MQMCVLLSLRTLILPPWGSGRVSGRRGYSGSFIITNDWRRSLPPSPLRGPLPPSGENTPSPCGSPPPMGENNHDASWSPAPPGRNYFPFFLGGTRCSRERALKKPPEWAVGLISISALSFGLSIQNILIKLIQTNID